MSQAEHVVLVNLQNQVIGAEEKIKAHRLGLLHRAFSVFVYRYLHSSLEFLLQQRHPDKYHSGGLWTNTCCSHPRVGEDIILAGQRRLKEEMSLELPLVEVGAFRYHAECNNGYTEHEWDHVLLGEYNGSNAPSVNPLEVNAFRWIPIHALQQELSLRPEQFTPWFKTALELVLEAPCFNS